ncbi:MAG: G/U mismatch-specific DNA glycosylase [Desulfomonilia bacterium]
MISRDAAPYRPTRREIREAHGKKIPDLISHDLRVLFCGINPGLYSGAVGHHFARPGNRFWRVLFAAGFTDRILSPFEERDLLDRGCGLTNIVERATAGSDELSREELIDGARTLAAKVREFKPHNIAFLGIQAYRTAFGRPASVPGRQPEKIEGATVWVLPSPSGLNAYYRFEDIVSYYRELRIEALG